MTEDTQTARISELEARLAKAEELLTAYVGLLDWLAEESEEIIIHVSRYGCEGDPCGGWFDDNQMAIIKEARDFIAAKKGE